MRPTRRGLAIGAAVVGAAAYLWFVSNGGHAHGGDTRAPLDLSYWVAEGHWPRLTEHPLYAAPDADLGYWAVRTEAGEIVSVYPPGWVLFGAPAFAVMRAAGLPLSIASAPLFGKLIAAAMMAAVCAIAFVLLARRHGHAAGALGVVALACGSSFHSSLAQAFWTQTAAVFAQALSCVLLPASITGAPTDPPSRHARWRLVGAGFFAAWAAFCRPVFAAWTLLLLLFLFLRDRRAFAVAGIGAAIAAILGFALNVVATGAPLGRFIAKATGEAGFTLSPLAIVAHLAGLLVSPSRGLLLFSPWAIIIFIALWWRRPRRGVPRDLWLDLHAAFVIVVVATLAAFTQWHGGWSAGPRLQSDLLFCGVLVAGPLLARVAGKLPLLLLFLVLLMPAVFIHGRAARMQNHPVEEAWTVRDADVTEHLWSWRHGAWVWYATNGRHERTLRGEERPPLLTATTLGPDTPEIDKFFGSGFGIEPKGRALMTTARTATLVFELPPALAAEDLVVGLTIVDIEHWLARRRLLFEFNGRRLAAFDHYPGAQGAGVGGRVVAVRVPRELLRAAPAVQTLTIREPYPPVESLGDAPLYIRQIVIDRAAAHTDDPLTRALLP